MLVEVIEENEFRRLTTLEDERGTVFLVKIESTAAEGGVKDKEDLCE